MTFEGRVRVKRERARTAQQTRTNLAFPTSTVNGPSCLSSQCDSVEHPQLISGRLDDHDKARKRNHSPARNISQIPHAGFVVLLGGLLLRWRHYHYWDVSPPSALLVKRVPDVSVHCTAPEFLIFFASRFMSNIFPGSTAERTTGVRGSHEIVIPAWIVLLSPIGSNESKRLGIGVIADAQQGYGTRQPALAPTVVTMTSGKPARTYDRVMRPRVSSRNARSM